MSDLRNSEHPPIVLAFTPGEPSGIGPDLAVIVAQGQLEQILVAYASADLLKERATQLGLPLNLIEVDIYNLPTVPAPAGNLYIKHIPTAVSAIPGMLDRRNSGYVLECIGVATKDCLSGICSGLVTGPIHKGIINEAGIKFSGHTEYLAELTNGIPVMMLACPGLRVALATTHVPLRNVSSAISRASLTRILRILEQDLEEKFGVDKPVIMVCGLNPHSGEGGHMGNEEIEIIIPTLEQLRHEEGMRLIGPIPADTAFTAKQLVNADAVLAMYHDQGLPVLKHLGFGQAVNITLGLPIVRTSVDHGTALDLAGTGRAEPGSLLVAINTAAEMCLAMAKH